MRGRKNPLSILVQNFTAGLRVGGRCQTGESSGWNTTHFAGLPTRAQLQLLRKATSRHPTGCFPHRPFTANSHSGSPLRSTPDQSQNQAATNTYVGDSNHPCCTSFAESELRLSGAKSKRTVKTLQIKLSLSTVPLHATLIDVLITPKLSESRKICGPCGPIFSPCNTHFISADTPRADVMKGMSLRSRWWRTNAVLKHTVRAVTGGASGRSGRRNNPAFSARRA
jgi:hypothetical protein